MGIFGSGFAPRLLNGINAMTQRYGEMTGDEGALLRLRAALGGAAFGGELAQRTQQDSDPYAIMQDIQADQYWPETSRSPVFIDDASTPPHMPVWTQSANGGDTFPYGGGVEPTISRRQNTRSFSTVMSRGPYQDIGGNWYKRASGR